MTLYAVTNPATGETVKEFPTATDVEIQAALQRTDSAFRQWTRSPLEERVKLLNRVAELYEERRDELAAIITREMGKPIRQAGFENRAALPPNCLSAASNAPASAGNWANTARTNSSTRNWSAPSAR